MLRAGCVVVWVLMALAWDRSAAAAQPLGSCSGVPNLVDRYTAVYGVDPQAESLDMYLPDDVVGEPIVVFIHGGAWVIGDKSEYVDLGRNFAVCGIAFAIVNYTLAPAARIDRQAAEVAQALRWIHDRAGANLFATSRVFLMGHSAGAEIAAFVSAGGDHALEQAGLTQSAIAGLIAMDGAGYLPSTTTRGVGLHPIRLFVFSEAFGSDPAAWGSYDIDRWLTGKEPPTLVVHAVDDSIAPEGESAALVAALQKAGDSVTYVQPIGRSHFSVLKGLTQGQDDLTFSAIVRFVTSRP